MKSPDELDDIVPPRPTESHTCACYAELIFDLSIGLSEDRQQNHMLKPDCRVQACEQVLDLAARF